MTARSSLRSSSHELPGPARGDGQPAGRDRRRRPSRCTAGRGRRPSTLVDVNISGFSRTNGQPSLTLTVSKASGRQHRRGRGRGRRRPSRRSIAQPPRRHRGRAPSQDLSIFIKESRDGLVREGLLGAFFAVLTIFLFLLSLRSTLVAAVSIPLSIFTALTVMGVAGLTINIITLGGLAVAVGRVVDDAIVVLENIFRHTGQGRRHRRRRARRHPRGGRRPSPAAPSRRSRCSCPSGFVGGIVSQFFLPFALTVTFALLASLFVALTVVPGARVLLRGARCTSRLDRDGELPETIWQRLYTPILQARPPLPRHPLGDAGHRARCCSWPRCRSCRRSRRSSSTPGSEAILAVTVSPPAGASADAVLARTEQVEARCSWPTPTSSSSRRASRATPTPAPRPSRRRSRVGRRTARR